MENNLHIYLRVSSTTTVDGFGLKTKKKEVSNYVKVWG